MRPISNKRHFLTTQSRGYKKKALDNGLNNTSDDIELIKLLQVQIALFFNNSVYKNKMDLLSIYKIYLNLVELDSSILSLKQTLINMRTKRYINRSILFRLDKFYSADPEFNVDFDIAQLLLNYETLINQSKYKIYRPSLRHLFLYFDILTHFIIIFKAYLNKYLTLAAPDEAQLEVNNIAQTDIIRQQTSDIILLMKEELNNLFEQREPPFKIYTVFESMLLETKWLIKIQITGFYGVEFTNDNAFSFLANVYHDFPVLHKWLTYEFINTGDITQALLNVRFALEEVTTIIRSYVYRPELSSSVSFCNETKNIVAISKFLHKSKFNNTNAIITRKKSKRKNDK